MQKDVAEWTGLEPATLDVTGRYSNQLNYHSALDSGEPGNQIPKSVILQHPRSFSSPRCDKKRSLCIGSFCAQGKAFEKSFRALLP